MADCPAVGCSTPTKPGMFMCRSHWFGLPKPIRDEVYRAWRAQELVDHAVICDEAIRYTACKEGKTPPTPEEQRAPRMRRIMGVRGG